ncbi:unnamed protein product [Malus baccata var. baccata]
MEMKRGEVALQWFNTTGPNNDHLVLSPYIFPENHLRRDSPSASLPDICWDPSLGNVSYQNAMLPNHLYQNPNPSQNTNLNNNTDFADQRQNQHHLPAALNRLSISNNNSHHHDHQPQPGGTASNLRANSFSGGNGFTTQYPSPHHVQEEEEYLERLKNQYVLLMAQMDQYVRLHGSFSNHGTTNNHNFNGALPHSLSAARGNFPLIEVEPIYTGGASRGGSSSTSRPNNIAQFSSADQFGAYGYHPMRPNNSLRNGLTSSRGSSSRYANGSGRQRLRTNFSSSSSLEQSGQVMTSSNLITKDHDHGIRGSRFANGSARQQHPSTFSLTLEEIRGQIALVAKDHAGSKFLQKKMEEGKPEEITIIFSEVMEADFRELMVDQFGNELVQKLVEAANKEGWSKMLDLVMSDEKKLKDICTDQHGSRAMQKLLERVETREQQSAFMRLLKHIMIPLSKTQPGYYVIQVCLKHFSPESTKGLLELVYENCLALAKDKFGCCLVQSSVHYAYTEAKERLVADITENARVLSEDPYGNYVVQYIIGLKNPRVTTDILAQLGGSFVNLCMNKYGSNVVEKILKEAGEEHVNTIVYEMINSPHFLALLQDPYGNYVAQSALGVSKGAAHNTLVQLVRSHYPYLHSHLYGKRVLDKTRGHRHRY